MRILFFSRIKAENQISPVIKAQADSLKKFVNVDAYPLPGKGWRAYIKGVYELRKYLKKNKPDVIHAHYSYVGMVASLATRRPVVVSLMGSDIEDYWIGRVLIRIFAKLSWKAVIVKSYRSRNNIGLKNAIVIPNGINLQLFKPIPKEDARLQLGLDPKKKHIIFLSHPGRKEKNYTLAIDSLGILDDKNAILIALHDKPQEEIPMYLAASDLLLLTSHFEGSPNAIKEAMACNCPIVSTDVGDVKEVIGDTEGCYITSFEPADVAAKIEKALNFDKRTLGRQTILHLNSDAIAQKLVEVYDSVLNH